MRELGVELRSRANAVTAPQTLASITVAPQIPIHCIWAFALAFLATFLHKSFYSPLLLPSPTHFIEGTDGQGLPLAVSTVRMGHRSP